MKCQMCGVINKLDVRYCESCGARLDASMNVVANADAHGLSALTCKQCSAVILPGERSCEQCGAPIATNIEATGISSELRVSDLPTGGFADTALDMNAFHAPTPSNMSGPLQYTIESDTPDDAANPIDADLQAGVVLPQNNENDPPQELASTPVEAPMHDAPAASHGAVEAVYEVVEISATATPSAIDIQALKQQRTYLEQEIQRQQDIINQLDAMRNTFREVTPQAVLIGITEAEQMLVGLRADLAALPMPTEIDPLLIERLTKDMARQVEIIEQFEQIQRTFGSATPRAVVQGITDARASVANIHAELTAFGVEVVPPRVQNPDFVPVPPVVAPAPVPARVVAMPADAVASPVPPVPPAPPLSSVPVIEPTPEAPAVPADILAMAVNSGPLAPMSAPDAPTITERPVGQVVNPVAPTARLQLESGTVLTLPSGRREIIIGRDDPISGVHPEVDMTPYGAESGGVSRRHVRLTILEGQWMITDLQSTNHTRVNGVRIDPGVPTQLPDGAQVVLGRIGFIFRCS
jgi:hypothetical protein